MKKIMLFVGVVLVASMLLTACGGGAPAAAAGPYICNVNDMGGVDDRSFNATAWKGATDANAKYGGKASYLDSKQESDYEKNVNAYLPQKCDIIICVGFLMNKACETAAKANPNQKFGYIDFAWDPAIPNMRASVYAINQATFLAGYLAASFTKTGKVGTYGGMQFPSVTDFMDGFALGVQKYNEVKGTNVEVLGWDMAANTGLFSGDFSDTDKGKNVTLTLLDQGADIIMPVAGPVGAGTLAALKERGTGLMIGVDTDWSIFYTDYQQFVLASALKKMDKYIVETVGMMKDGTFKGETWTANLENDGVGLAIGAAFKDKVSAEMVKELDALKADIIAKKLETGVKR